MANTSLHAEDNRFYNMNNKSRGVALIFNHEQFEMKHLNSRKGTKVDCERLSLCLDNLGFLVLVYNDLSYMQICKVLDEAASSDYSETDCFFLAVLSHGNNGVLCARDNMYKANHLYEYFTNEKCPSLVGKPRIFVIQACQGDSLDSGVAVRRRADADYMGYKIPFHPDFLIAYSTIPGFYSWINTMNGSWFIESLCEELKAYGTRYNILTILTFVCQRVAINYESFVLNDGKLDKQKQIPCIISMFTRILKFTKK